MLTEFQVGMNYKCFCPTYTTTFEQAMNGATSVNFVLLNADHKEVDMIIAQSIVSAVLASICFVMSIVFIIAGNNIRLYDQIIWPGCIIIFFPSFFNFILLYFLFYYIFYFIYFYFIFIFIFIFIFFQGIKNQRQKWKNEYGVVNDPETENTKLLK